MAVTDTDLVERVARAIYDADQEFMTQHGIPIRRPFEEISGPWLVIAKAAIASMPARTIGGDK